MTATLLSDGSVFVDEEVQHEAEQFAETAHDRSVRGILIQLEDGSEQSLPPRLVEFVTRVLSGTANGPISVNLMPEELTTTQAADMLGVSRPTLMKLVSGKQIPSHKVGSHTRLNTRDVLTLREQRKSERAAAFARLRAWDEENGPLAD
ncbi:helix-turn-helix domain-containing protein [Leifsonia sp. 22587]|uniref:helix-turn-helix domain-containing protein n=1 Tax=Leifsonia sp. 22587 TaxID=3453946 RepID=UPI003F82D3DA